MGASFRLRGVTSWTKAWRALVVIFLAISGYGNYKSNEAAYIAQARATAAESRIMQLELEVADLNSKVTVVTIFLSVQKEAQKTESVKRQFQDVIDILQKKPKSTQ